MIKYHNLEQCSDEWFQLRIGKLTGSNATAIGANGKGLETYCKKICLEMSGVLLEQFTSADMERGNQLEPIARAAYELEKGLEVEEVGFITNSKFENCGFSPDGLVSSDGGIEIKARNNEKHFSLIMGETKEIPFNQIQFGLLISERKWWDFVSYNPNFSKPLFVNRVFPDLGYFEKLESGIIQGNKLIKEYSKKYIDFRLN